MVVKSAARSCFVKSKATSAPANLHPPYRGGNSCYIHHSSAKGGGCVELLLNADERSVHTVKFLIRLAKSPTLRLIRSNTKKVLFRVWNSIFLLQIFIFEFLGWNEACERIVVDWFFGRFFNKEWGIFFGKLF